MKFLVYAVLLLPAAGIGHCLLSYRSTLRGISKLQLDANKLAADLDNSWEVLAEPIQTVGVACDGLQQHVCASVAA
jgi:adenylosuccinate lyase